MPLHSVSGRDNVCAVLAAQVVALRESIDAGATIEFLWHTSDVLLQLSALVQQLARHSDNLDSSLRERCDAAVAAEAAINASLGSLAFSHAQRNDFTCQTIDCVATALERLAVSGTGTSRLSLEDLSALYVCEAQRTVHDKVVGRQDGAALRQLAEELRHREAFGT